MILFVDDEKHRIEVILAELDILGVPVSFCAGVDEALNLLENNRDKVQAIVCDVMMPHGESYSAAQTDNNRLTGLVFLEDLRRRGFQVPVVLLTYLDATRAPVDEAAGRFPPCTVVRKREKWSFEIAEIIRDLVHGKPQQ